MAIKTVRTEGGTNVRPTILPDLLPKQLELPKKTIADGLESGKPVFSQLNCDKVKRVILVTEEKGISWPLLQTAILGRAAASTFRNAEIVDFGGLMQLFKDIEPSRLTTVEGSLNEDYGKFKDLMEDTVVFDMRSQAEDTRMLEMGAIVVKSPDFAKKGNSSVRVTTSHDSWIDPTRAAAAGDIKSIRRRQSEMLKGMGMTGVPDQEEDFLLTEEKYGEGLTTAIDSMEAEIKRQKGEGRPLILVTPGKRTEKNFQRYPQLLDELVRVARRLNATIAVNKWKPSGQVGEEGMGEAIEKKLSGLIFKRSRVVDLGSLGKKQLAAAMHLTKKTGGCCIHPLSGASQLAEIMNAPEVQLGMEDPTWEYLRRPRKNSKELPYTSFKGQVLPAVQELIQR